MAHETANALRMADCLSDTGSPDNAEKRRERRQILHQDILPRIRRHEEENGQQCMDMTSAQLGRELGLSPQAIEQIANENPGDLCTYTSSGYELGTYRVLKPWPEGDRQKRPTQSQLVMDFAVTLERDLRISDVRAITGKNGRAVIGRLIQKGCIEKIGINNHYTVYVGAGIRVRMQWREDRPARR